MDNYIYNKNMEVIKKYYPQIAEGLENFTYDSDVENEAFVDIAVDGKYIVGERFKERDWYYNSRYYPLEAAGKWAEQYTETNFKTVFIIMGLANGMYIQELLSIIDDTNKVIVFEPNPALFCLLIQYVDISSIICDKRVILSVKSFNDQAIIGAIEILVDYSNLHLMEYIQMPNYNVIYADEWHKIVKQIKDKVENIVLNRNTKIAFKYELIDNMFINYRDMVKQYTINQIKYKFEELRLKDIPAILVAAGPSLDKNIIELKKAKGKAFIVCVDTALNSMASVGIRPDIAITIDPHKPVSLFQADIFKDIPMVVIPYSNKDVVMMLGGKHFYSGGDEYISGFYRKYGKEPAMPLDTGGSVANDAFSFIRYLGFETIIMVGQDLAYTDNKSHTSYAYGDDNNKIGKVDDNMEMVDAVGGGKVTTSKVMKAYNSWFEKQIMCYPDLKVINATEGGAVKKGSREMALREAIEEFCHSNIDFDAIFDAIPEIFSKNEQEEIYKNFENINKDIDGCVKEIEKGIRAYDKMVELYRNGKAGTREYEKILDNIKKINEYASENSIMQLADLYIAEESYEVDSEVYNTENDEMEEIKRINYLGKKMLKAYKRELIKMKDDTEYMKKSKITQNFIDKTKLILIYADYTILELRRDNVYTGIKEYNACTKWIKYVAEVYLLNATEINSYDIILDVNNLLQSVELMNKALELKDYVALSDLLEKNIKKIFINIIDYSIKSNIIYIKDNTDENICILEEFDNELYECINNKKMQGKKYIEEITEYGCITIKSQEMEGRYLNSRCNPKLEARLQMETIDLKNKKLLILGLGLGYLVEEIVDNGYNGTILVFETDIEVIRHAIKWINLRKIYTKCKFKIIYDPMLVIFSSEIKNGDFELYIHRASIENIQDAKIKQLVQEVQMCRDSIREQENLLVRNFNLNITDNINDIGLLKNKFINKSVIYIAGGPSLEKNIEELKNKASCDEYIILSCGTAYKPLMKRGIIPDYVVVSDAKESITRQISDMDYSSTALLYLSTVDKSVIDMWGGEKYIIFQNGFEQAEEYAQNNGFMTVQVGGSVSTVALSLSVGLGVSRFICIGLDLAYVDSKLHADEQETVNNKNMRSVRAVDGTMIYTNINLDIYRHWIERYIKDIDNVEFINCSC